jgi:hypothetical protein
MALSAVIVDDEQLAPAGNAKIPKRRQLRTANRR